MQNQIRNGRSPTVSDALQKKLSTNITAIQSEIVGATTQIGAKLGGDIGMEIQKEHPEYFRNLKPAPKPQQ